MARITVKFFKIEKVHQSAPDLDVALNNAYKSAEKASERERLIMARTLRLERLAKDNMFYDGEIVRKQTGDIPPVIPPFMGLFETRTTQPFYTGSVS